MGCGCASPIKRPLDMRAGSAAGTLCWRASLHLAPHPPIAAGACLSGSVRWCVCVCVQGRAVLELCQAAGMLIAAGGEQGSLEFAWQLYLPFWPAIVALQAHLTLCSPPPTGSHACCSTLKICALPAATGVPAAAAGMPAAAAAAALLVVKLVRFYLPAYPPRPSLPVPRSIPPTCPPACLRCPPLCRIPYETFSLRLNNADLPYIREILRNVSDVQYRGLMEQLVRYRDAFHWLPTHGGR